MLMMSLNFSFETTTDSPTILCDIKTNPWCEEFGVRQYVELVYLLLVTFCGSVGNIVVILSLSVFGNILQNGNLFTLNLAVADLIVTGICVPSVIPNIILKGPALPHYMCQVFGYLVCTTCAVSTWSLCFIALNRLFAVVYNRLHKKFFSTKNVCFVLAFIWTWSNLLTLPTITGWSTIIYDHKSMVCLWDDQKSFTFNIYMVIGGMAIPVGTIGFCYAKTFHFVKKSRARVERHQMYAILKSTKKRKKSLRKEVNLAITFLVTTVVFLISWMPIGIVFIFFPQTVSASAKKICVWIGASNSTVNFIIYGLTNKKFRDNYKKLFSCISIHKCSRRSTALSFGKSSTYAL